MPSATAESLGIGPGRLRHVAASEVPCRNDGPAIVGIYVTLLGGSRRCAASECMFRYIHKATGPRGRAGSSRERALDA